MRIGIDIDGVLRNTYNKLVEVYLKTFPNEWCRPVQEWNSYLLSDNFSIGDDIYDFFFNSLHTKEIYLTAPIFKYTKELNTIAKTDTVEIITHQPNSNTEVYALQWMHQHKLNYDGIHFTQQKWAVDCDVYVEDSPEQIHELLHYGKNVVVIDYKYNKNGPDGPFDGAVTRVPHFGKFVDRVLNGEF